MEDDVPFHHETHGQFHCSQHASFRPIKGISISILEKKGHLLYPPEMNMSPAKGLFKSYYVVFQPLFFRGCVSFRGSSK